MVNVKWKRNSKELLMRDRIMKRSISRHGRSTEYGRYCMRSKCRLKELPYLSCLFGQAGLSKQCRPRSDAQYCLPLIEQFKTQRQVANRGASMRTHIINHELYTVPHPILLSCFRVETGGKNFYTCIFFFLFFFCFVLFFFLYSFKISFY